MTAVLIGATMLVLGLPLAFTVALVTFATSYIPYLGAIFSATFACLVAIGSGSLTQAFVLLVVILVVQNVVQTVMSTKLTSDRLSLHPIASLVSTIVGASLGGLFGARRHRCWRASSRSTAEPGHTTMRVVRSASQTSQSRSVTVTESTETSTSSSSPKRGISTPRRCMRTRWSPYAAAPSGIGNQ